jgi:hypothetical protein
LEGKVSELWSKAFQKGREGVAEVTK